ncbi:MAG: homoserine kinase [Acidiferrobacterales bacterium]
MSVYTSITADELKKFLTEYDAGTLVRFTGIESGIENTNYFVTTTGGQFVLTIFEQHTKKELPFFLDLTAYLAEHDIPCAHPLANNSGLYLGNLKDKPAALVNRLDGSAVGLPTLAQCSAVGNVLARMHKASDSFSQQRLNPRGHTWRADTTAALMKKLSAAEIDILAPEIAYQSKYDNLDLTNGIIHADLFRDNALFDGDSLCGVIDFYYACTDYYLYDLAIAVNDWCSNGDGSLDQERASHTVKAYLQARPVVNAEIEAWPLLLRAGALRFWLSRLYDMHFPRPGEMTHIKDPEAFRRILQDRIKRGADMIALWS